MNTKLEENLQMIHDEIVNKIIPENIRKGVTIFGVEGTLEEEVKTTE